MWSRFKAVGGRAESRGAAGLTGPLMRFAAVGAAGTPAYLALYAVLRTVARPR